VAALYGLPVEFPGSVSHSPNHLLGSRIAVPQASTLTHIGIIVKGEGAQVKVGIYTEVAGEPGTLIASTAATPLVLGRMELPVPSTDLPAGNYWFMAVYDVAGQVGYAFDEAAVSKYVVHQFADPLPTTFPSATSETGPTFNYYLRATVP
jgi:hypothetical protein